MPNGIVISSKSLFDWMLQVCQISVVTTLTFIKQVPFYDCSYVSGNENRAFVKGAFEVIAIGLNMGRVIKNIWRLHRLLFLACAFSCCVFVFIAVMAVSSVVHYWAGSAHQDQPLEAWMTARYVGRSYQVPHEVIREAFVLNESWPTDTVSVGNIAIDQNMTIAELQERLDEFVAAWRAEHPGKDGYDLWVMRFPRGSNLSAASEPHDPFSLGCSGTFGQYA